MDGTAAALGEGLVGLATELAAIKAFLDGAATGVSGTLLVTGDAGVGKTFLVQQACSTAGSSPWIFAGAALPLASMTVPFLPLRSAFRHAPSIDGVARPLHGVSGDSRPDVPVAIDAWLENLCALRPVVLIVDDLHWADASTLDVLMYLIAGPSERRLAIIATVRNGELWDGHPLVRWLADIRRLPRVGWLALGPLDRIDTGVQLAGLLGAPPHQSLVQEVFTHTAGNAYLNKLVVADVQADARHLPIELAADLKSALLRSWTLLSPDAQTITQLLAVAGRPLRARDLEAVMAATELTPAALPLLHEGANAGILDCEPDATHWWFHHPLIAEALLQRMDGDAFKHWHAAFAVFHEDSLAGANKPDFQDLAALAEHHHFAGHIEEAYVWALRAASAAGDAGGTAEMVRLLRRALTLRVRLPDAPETFEDLWSSLRTVAEESGAQADELEAVEALLALVDGGARPLDRAELLVRRTLLRYATGRSFMDLEDTRTAVRLSAVAPDSWQYALALAEFAHAGLWHGSPGAAEQAGEALKVAVAASHPRALSYALTANAMAALDDSRAQDCRELAGQAVAAAVQARDFWAYVHATLWQANATASWTSQHYADLMRAGRAQLLALGAPHAYVAKLAADEASSYLVIGRWRECTEALRVAHGSDPGVMADVDSRLTGARLAALQGRTGEAEAHLARADELYAAKAEFLNLGFDAIRAEVFLAAGNPAAALVAAMRGATAAGMQPTMCEWLIPLAARALADLVGKARDEGLPPAQHLALLDDLVQRFPQVLQESGDTTEAYQQQLAALNLLYDAEVGRARDGSNNARQWSEAADALHLVSFLWEATYACWRGAVSLLLHAHAHRTKAASLLRRGLDLAAELQAAPLQELLADLAARARIDTTTPAVPDMSGQWPDLTPREREILGYVIAGRTYSEIARTLVISEKTVSSHISNLLRKSGAANRLDLSRLATRRAGAEQRPPSVQSNN
ncbi:helix-turn-helix transcriptional regulator [Arthrobacter sp. TMN-49]